MLPAFVLHTRPYRETSQLVDLFVASWQNCPLSLKVPVHPVLCKGLLQPFFASSYPI